MMSYGFFALLDDVAAIAKTAAATLDEVATTTANTTIKSAGLVIDDTAVAPKYVVGFSANRELPIIGKITLGSLRNKLLFLLPLALILGYLTPFLIMPLLMIGGFYLSFEGVEKIMEYFRHHTTNVNVNKDEVETIRSAVCTDFILSAEIMVMALATVADRPVAVQMAVLVLTGIFITALVYGSVAIIVRADDIGLHLVKTSPHAPLRTLGKGLVMGMPYFLKMLTSIGTIAMLWVGGGILLHGVGLEHISHNFFIEMLVSIMCATVVGAVLIKGKSVFP